MRLLLLAAACCCCSCCCCCLLKRVAHPRPLKGGVKPRQGKPSSVTLKGGVKPRQGKPSSVIKGTKKRTHLGKKNKATDTTTGDAGDVLMEESDAFVDSGSSSSSSSADGELSG